MSGCEAELCPNWAGFGCVCDALGIDSCDHQWLDRPESDTRECMVCGEER
jgi:hypothetical protein